MTAPDASEYPYPRPAPLGDRLSAGFRDWLLVLFVWAVALKTAEVTISSIYLPPLLALVIAWGYFAGFESSKWQATIFQKKEKLRVTDLAGNRISLGRASLRFAGKLVILASMGVGVLLILWTRPSRALDDLIAGTQMVSMTPPDSKTKTRLVWNSMGIRYLVCFVICSVSAYLWQNFTKDVSGEKGRPDFLILVRDTTDFTAPLKKIKLQEWDPNDVSDTRWKLQLQPGTGEIPKEPYDYIHVTYKARPVGNALEVTLNEQNEYTSVEYVYLVEGDRVRPQTRQEQWPWPYAVFSGFILAFLLMLAVSILEGLVGRYRSRSA